MGADNSELAAFVERYLAMWNEGDPAQRRRLVEELWIPDCANFTRLNEYRGHAVLEARVTISYDKWVRDAGCLFRTRSFERHHGALRFTWEMVDAKDGKLHSVGHEFLLLADDGRIRADYQFIEPAA